MNLKKELRYQKLENIKGSEQIDGLLVLAIVECIRQAFGEAPADTPDHLNGDEILLAGDGEKVVLYYSAFHNTSPREHLRDESLTDEKGTYLSALTIDPRQQGHGLSKEVYDRSLTPKLRERIPLIFLRTQNPRIEAGITSYLKRAKKRGDISGFTIERRLLEKVYGQMLTTIPARSDNPEIQARYDTIDRAAGDAFLLIFHLRYAAEGSRHE